MTKFSYLILGAAYAFAAAVHPGPFQAYLISQTIANGWRRTVPAVLAPILSDVPIVGLVLLALTRVPPFFLHVLQIAGGLYLLYLASGAFASYRNYRPVPADQTLPVRKTVLRAVLINLLNPSPYLSWSLVLGPLLIHAWRQAPLIGVAFVGTFYGTMASVTAVILLLFAAARSLGPVVTRVLVGVSAAALALFGGYQLWTGSTAFARLPG